MDHQFRIAKFNGFNKEDVVSYFEAITKDHDKKIKRLQKLLKEAEEQLEDKEQELQAAIEEITEAGRVSSETIVNTGVNARDLTEQLEKAMAEIEVLKQENTSYNLNSENSGDEATQLRVELEEKDIELSDLQWQLDQLKGDYDALKDSGGEGLGSDGGDAELIQDLEDEIRDLKKKLNLSQQPSQIEDELRDEIDVLEAEVTSLRNQLEDAPSSSGDMSQSSIIEEELRDEIDVLEAEVASLRKEIENGSDTPSQHAEIEEELRDEIELLEKEIVSLRAQVNSSMDINASSEPGKDTSALETELECRVQELKNSQIRLENMASTIDELENALEECELELKQTKDKLESGDLTPPPVVLHSGEEELNKAKLEIADLANQLHDASQRADDAELKLDSMTQTIADLEFTAQGYDARTQQLLSRLDNAERENQRLSSMTLAEEHIKDTATLTQDLHESKQELRTMKESESLLRSQLSEANHKINQLEAKALEESSTVVHEEQERLLEDARAEIQSLEEKLERSQSKMQALDTQLQECEEKLSAVEALKEQLAEKNEALEEQEDLSREKTLQLEEKDKLLAQQTSQLESEKESSLALKSQLEEAHEELHTMSRLRTQLREAQEELETLTKAKSQLREAREELESMNRVKNQLRDAQEELEDYSKLKGQLKAAQEELGDCTKLKSQLREANEQLEEFSKTKTMLKNAQEELEYSEKFKKDLAEKQETVKKLTTRLDELEDLLDEATVSAEHSMNEEISRLTQQIEEMELSLGDEKRHNATLSNELDELLVELSKRKNTEWNLQEKLKKVQMSHDVLQHKVTRLEPPAKAYLNIKDRVENMEREAQFRAHETINQAEAEVFRVQQQVEQWLARVNASYSSLCKELDDNINTVDQGLSRASNALSQISSVIKIQDSPFSHLGRTISATSSAPKAGEEQQEPDDDEWTKPADWSKETEWEKAAEWLKPAQPNWKKDSSDWEKPADSGEWQNNEPAKEWQKPPQADWQSPPPGEDWQSPPQADDWQSPPPDWQKPPSHSVPMPDWSASTIPNSASPGNWSSPPSPLPLDDYGRNKPQDLYEALDALEGMEGTDPYPPHRKK